MAGNGHSVRWRLTVAVVAVVAVATLLGATGLVAGLYSVLSRDVRATATLRAAEAARVVDAGGDPVAAVAGDDDLVLQVVDRTGVVLAASPALAGRPALVPGVVAVPPDDEYLVVRAAAGDRTVLVGQSLDPVTESTGALLILLAIAVPGLLVIVGLVGWRAIGRALAPVDAIRAEVDEITATQLHRRVPQPAVADEIGRLASTMNRMLDRLEQAHTGQRRFVADASHELRSPLAAIRQHAEVALAHPDRSEGLAATVHLEALRMQSLVDDLLLLAGADEAAGPLRRTPVDLDDLVLEQARRLRDTGQLVDTTGVSAARVDGDLAALRRLLRNLTDNAARHARERVALSVAAVDGHAVLHVDDDGPGVPEPDRARVFERFVRLDGARARATGGAGLGLAIVAEIAAAHGGSAVLDATRSAVLG
jgi:signal transduction histidine kinase